MLCIHMDLKAYIPYMHIHLSIYLCIATQLNPRLHHTPIFLYFPYLLRIPKNPPTNFLPNSFPANPSLQFTLQRNLQQTPPKFLSSDKTRPYSQTIKNLFIALSPAAWSGSYVRLYMYTPQAVFLPAHWGSTARILSSAISCPAFLVQSVTQPSPQPSPPHFTI